MYQIKENQECSNMVANILPTDAPPPPPLPLTLMMGSVGQNSTFSEHGQVAYQIKENQGFSNMVANILPAYSPTPHPPHTPLHTHTLEPEVWVKQNVKIQLFKNMVMLHFKLKRIRNAAAT